MFLTRSDLSSRGERPHAPAANLMNDELAAVLEQQVEAQENLNAAIAADGLPFYKPHAKQDQFHRATAKRRMVRAGNRWGKSQSGCAEDVAWLRGERLWYAKDDPARTSGIPDRAVKGLTITTDWDKVDEIWTGERGEKPGKVWRYLPKGLVKSKKRNHSGAIDTIECVNGSLWRFDTVKSFMANPQGSESSDWDFIHVDEPCPELMFKAAARGLIDRGGSAWFTLTPLSEFWINDYFFPQDTGGALRDNVWAINGSIYDNPYLDQDAIKEYEGTLTEDEKQCRLYGLPMHLAGLVYKTFEWDKHVLKDVPFGWKDFATPPDNYTIYYNIDPHPRTPHAVLFCAVSPLGQRFYYNDIFDHTTVESLSKQIREHIAGRHVGGVRIDPAAYIDDPITGTNMATEFHRCGIPVAKATKALAQGILRVNMELARDPQCIWFCPSARTTLWEIQRYAWDQKPARLNKPIDVDDHMMENMYRMELSEPIWLDPDDAKGTIVPELEITRTECTIEDLEFSFN